MDLKIKRLLRKVAKTKVEIDNLQEDLKLVYDKLKTLGVTEEELEGVCKIKLVNSERTSWNSEELINFYGEEIKRFQTHTQTSFYRTTIDKDFYKNN